MTDHACTATNRDRPAAGRSRGARLATIDDQGYPHVTPIWFSWTDGAFYLTSYAGRPHLARIVANPRVGLVVDTEDAQRADGERPNRQIRIVGDAAVSVDVDGLWTRRIRRTYLDPTISPDGVERHPSRERALIVIRPRDIRAVASV